MWGHSLPWHEVLSAVVAELSIYNIQYIIYIYIYIYIIYNIQYIIYIYISENISFRVTENRCVLLILSLIYIYVRNGGMVECIIFNKSV